MSDDRDSLLREVDEELRREQMQKLWERYNGLILGAAALIVVAVGGFKLWQSQRIAAAESAGAEFTAAVHLSDEKKADEARAAFQKIADSGPEGYASLARLHLAGTAAKAGKTAEALSAYDALANDPHADELLKSFAQLQAAALRLDDGDFTDLQNRLTPLAAEGSAFRTSAQELLGLAALKARKFDEARKQFEPLLIDPDASRAIQERIKIALAKIAQAETGGAPQAPAEAAKPAPGATEPVKTDAAAPPAAEKK